MKKLGIWILGLLILMGGSLPMNGMAVQIPTAEIPVRIETEGAAQKPDAVYTVLLEAVTSDAPMPVGSTDHRWTMTLKAGESAYLSIPCQRLGIFDYTIRQIPGKDPGCDYDETRYPLRLQVTQAEDDSISVTALLFGQEGEKLPAVIFTNRWPKPAELSILAWKTMDGKTPKDHAFTFLLSAEDGSLSYEITNVGRRVRFPKLYFDREGTFRFFLEEIPGGNRKIIYDKSLYTITVTVTKDVDYHAAVSYEKDGEFYSGNLSFANYTDTESPKTGDTIGIWFALMGISAAALGAVLVFRRKKQ